MDDDGARPPRARPALEPWAVALALFAAHAVLRVGSLWRPALLPLSMVLIWPAPWILADREGRRALGLRRPAMRSLALGAVVGLAALLACAALAFAVHGDSPANWFLQHARALARAGEAVPARAGAGTLFWFLTVPAMVFSPLGEEILFRGFLLRGLAERLGTRAANVVQAALFALIHLVHYGLRPLQPELLPVWLLSMFGVAWLLGWLVRRHGSLWPAVVAHSVFNLAMNAVSWLAFPGEISG
jgi:uncharacterized protein